MMTTMMPGWPMKRGMWRTSIIKRRVSNQNHRGPFVQVYRLAGMKEDNAEGALKAFRTIVESQADKGEW